MLAGGAAYFSTVAKARPNSPASEVPAVLKRRRYWACSGFEVARFARDRQLAQARSGANPAVAVFAALEAAKVETSERAEPSEMGCRLLRRHG